MTMNSFILALAVLSMLSGIFTTVHADFDIDSILEKGEEKNSLGNYMEAIANFDKVLEIEPNNIQALNSKGIALNNLKMYEEAKNHFDMVLEIEPDNETSLYQKGRSEYLMGHFEEAVFYFEKVIQINSTFSMAYSNLGISLAMTGNLDEAEEKLLKALELDPNNEYAAPSLLNLRIIGSSIIYEGFVELILRDNQGNLVAYSKNNRITGFDSEFLKNWVSSWPTKKIIYDNQIVEAFDKVRVLDMHEDKVVATTGFLTNSNSTNTDFTVLRSVHNGYLTVEGDTFTILYSIFSPLK